MSITASKFDEGSLRVLRDSARTLHALVHSHHHRGIHRTLGTQEISHLQELDVSSSNNYLTYYSISNFLKNLPHVSVCGEK